MRFLLGFFFGALSTGNRVFRIGFLLILLVLAFCLYQMSKPLTHNNRLTPAAAQTR